ncbi:hypothetical protein [Rubritalea tangerina]|uniref:hypothetical protein n=1 Tax=Rubritalea tangerina TaxID=430798 RepID=UPI003609C15D
MNLLYHLLVMSLGVMNVICLAMKLMGYYKLFQVYILIREHQQAILHIKVTTNLTCQ